MSREFFKNLPDTTTPLNAQRMNGFLNGNEAMGSIVVDDISCTDSTKAFGYTSGSNENGSWVKYDDGRMECWGNKAIGNVECTTVWGSLYYGQIENAITYPQEFTSVESVDINAIPTTSSAFMTMPATRNFQTTGFSGIMFLRPSSGTVSPIVTYRAIGRWK